MSASDSDIDWLLARYRDGSLTLAEVADHLGRARAETAEWRARAEERERLLEERQSVVEALRRTVRALEAATRLAEWQAQTDGRVIEVDESPPRVRG
jgi:hypothetical protein